MTASIENMFKKYGFILPKTSGKITLKNLLNPHQEAQATELTVSSTVTRYDSGLNERIYLYPYDSQNPQAANALVRTSNKPRELNQFYKLLLDWNRPVSAEKTLLQAQHFSHKTRFLLLEKLLNFETMNTFQANCLHVNQQELTEIKDEILDLLCLFMGPFKPYDPFNPEAGEEELLIESEIPNFTHTQSESIKDYSFKNWSFADKSWALYRALDIFGQTPSNPILAKDFKIVSTSMAEALNRILPMPTVGLVEVLNNSAEEIYQSLREENKRTAKTLPRTQLLEAALELS